MAVLVPALAEKVITPVSTYEDTLTTFIDYNQEEYSPINYNDYLGKITVRRAVESSQNIPFVQIIEELTPTTSIQYLKKMGISTLNEKDENLALSLGGLDNGISPLEMAGAYAMIANDGVYIEPTFYTQILDNSGKNVLNSKQKSRRVISEAVAFVTKQLLTEPVVGNNGTATYCSIPGMEVAAKTGTTNEDYDRWLCGFTNYYTAVTWFGFDLSEPIRYHGNNPAGIIWSNVMTQIHKKLKNSDFAKAKNVENLKICRKSLKVANSGCQDTFTEYFIKGTTPEICTIHQGNAPKNVENTNTKQKIKDTVKNTTNSVKTEINQRPEESIPDIKQSQEETNDVLVANFVEEETKKENSLPEESENQTGNENSNQNLESNNIETNDNLMEEIENEE